MQENAPLIEECPTCGALVDVTEQGIFALAHCPTCGTAMRVRHELNHFSLEEIVGVGGMGTVYKALDSKLNRHIAIKVLKPEFGLDQELIQKLEREARITASINHPNVVKVYSFGSALGQFYLAMELVEKGSLDELMLIQTRVAEMQMLSVGIQIAEGLDAAYQKGLIHSDVKPGNILFADAKTAKIVDFGLAEMMEDESGEKGEVWGTPYYVSPERLNHEPEDFRSDLYSLGGTLFHALAGRPPFEAENASLVALKHVRSKAVSLQAFAPDISSETAYVINRMLKKNPDERYSSYTELVEHLTYAKKMLEERVASPRKKKERVVVEGDKLKATMGWLTLVALLVVLGLVGVAALNWRKIFKAPTSGDGETVAVKKVIGMSAAELEQRFEAARTIFAGGQHEAALKEFTLIRESGPLQQPLRSWVAFFEGSAQLSLGQLKESAAIFNSIVKEGMFSMDPANQSLANFFMETSRVLASKDPVGRSTARLYSLTSIEAFSLYLFALKNYQMGWMEDSAPLLLTFIGTRPGDPYVWINQFKPGAKVILAEIQPLYRAYTLIDTASTADKLKAAQEQLNTVEKSMTGNVKMLPSLERLRSRLDKNLEGLKPEPTPTPTPTPSAKDIEKSKAELQKFQTLQTEIDSLVADWRFNNALQIITEFKPETPAAIKVANLENTKIKALVTLRNRLLKSINASPYPKELKTRSGATLPPGAAKADLKGIQVAVKYGTQPASWSDIQPESIGDMADYYRGLEKDESAKTEWLWSSGVYLHQAGLTTRARPLLLEASGNDPKYRDLLEGIYSAKAPL